MKRDLMLYSVLAFTLLLTPRIWAETYPAWIDQTLKDDGFSKAPNELAQYPKTDLGALWLEHQDNVLGYIGKDYQRFFIRFKHSSRSDRPGQEYFIDGKTKVKKNICDFKGKLTIQDVRFAKQVSGRVDQMDEIIPKGILVGTYDILEDEMGDHPGRFQGYFVTYVYKNDQGAILYDDLGKEGDGFHNNWFVGTWQANDGKTTKVCNWGDYRIPQAAELDCGAGEFSPDPKYRANGWQDYTLGFSPKNIIEDKKP